MTDPTDRPPSDICATCGREVEATYCSHCGEKVLTDHDHSLWHFVSEWFELFMHFDSKFLRTVKLLVSRPGFLTTEYWAGRRVRYMKPFQLLILLNVIYYVSAFLSSRWGSHISIMVPSLYDIMSSRVYSGIIAPIVRAHVAAHSIDWSAYQAGFNAHLEHLSKSLVVLLVPMVAVMLRLIFFRSRKSLLDHFTASLHLISFYILLGSAYLLLIGMLTKLFSLSPYHYERQGMLSYIPLAALVAYFIFTFRHAYRQSILWTLVATGLLVFVCVPVITQVYDLILFFLAYPFV